VKPVTIKRWRNVTYEFSGIRELKHHARKKVNNMPYKDPEKYREYMREYQKRKRKEFKRLKKEYNRIYHDNLRLKRLVGE
jgi:hypothetical protein